MNKHGRLCLSSLIKPCPMMPDNSFKGRASRRGVHCAIAAGRARLRMLREAKAADMTAARHAFVQARASPYSCYCARS
jgi:hypothetical protein